MCFQGHFPLVKDGVKSKGYKILLDISDLKERGCYDMEYIMFRVSVTNINATCVHYDLIFVCTTS